MQERNALDSRMNALTEISRELSDNLELAEMAEDEGDTATLDEAARSLVEARKRAERLQLEALLSGEADSNDTYLEVHAGAGGTESQDWALMLMRMYTRWAERRGFKVEVVEESAGEEAGIKSTTLLIKGHNAYGWLKTEAGVHRLVRISPFDSNARRHTSFASATVYPVVDDKIDIQINESDVRVDTMRSGGAGGQHVNKTESAVRITHIPTNTVVLVQDERSQHKNRARAMAILRSRIFDEERRRLAATRAEDRRLQVGSGDRSERIRTYNFPQGRVTDHRIELTLYKLPEIMAGTALGEIIDALIADHQAGLLALDSAA